MIEKHTKESEHIADISEDIKNGIIDFEEIINIISDTKQNP